MDDVYRVQRFIYDATRKYYLFGRDTAIDELDLKPGARLVEVGCGTARNLVRIARRYPHAKLFGLDASHEMLRTARRSLERSGLSQAIVLSQGYAEELSPAQFGAATSFDVVLFSYSLSMIPDWRAALKAAENSLAPQGKVHIVDFADFHGLMNPLAHALRAWLAQFHVVPCLELLNHLERQAERKEARVRMLPGRYAFRASYLRNPSLSVRASCCSTDT